MITAQEAKQLREVSDKAVEEFMVKIDPIIRQAANEGKSRVPLYTIDYGTKLWGSVEEYKINKDPSPIQKRVIDKLKTLGFGASLQVDGSPYVPQGLVDDEGNGPKYQNVVIVVSW